MALLTVQILFGLNYVISKVVVTHFPPLVWASIRIIISAIILGSIAIALKRPFPKDGKKFFIPLIGLALLGSILNQASFLVGLRLTTSTNSAILNTLIPVFTFLIVMVRGQEKVNLRKIIGLLSAFVGVLTIRKIENFKFSDQTFIGDLLMIFNCFCYGLFLSYGKKFLEKYDQIWVTTWIFIYGSVGLTIFAIPDYLQFQMPILTPVLLGSAIFAVIGGTLLTYFLNNWALAYADSTHVAIFIYIQPVVAALLAWAWLGEIITFRSFLSSLLIFVGVLLVRRSR